MALHGPTQRLSFLRIPEPDSIIHTARSDHRAVGRVCHRQHPAGVPLEGVQRRTGLAVPNPSRRVSTSRDHGRRVDGGEGGCQDGLAVACNGGSAARNSLDAEYSLRSEVERNSIFGRFDPRLEQRVV